MTCQDTEYIRYTFGVHRAQGRGRGLLGVHRSGHRPGIVPQTKITKLAKRDYRKRDVILENAEVVKPGNHTLQFDAIDQENCHRDLGLADVV
jgi:hypothetical protein